MIDVVLVSLFLLSLCILLYVSLLLHSVLCFTAFNLLGDWLSSYYLFVSSCFPNDSLCTLSYGLQCVRCLMMSLSLFSYYLLLSYCIPNASLHFTCLDSVYRTDDECCWCTTGGNWCIWGEPCGTHGTNSCRGRFRDRQENYIYTLSFWSTPKMLFTLLYTSLLIMHPLAIWTLLYYE